MIISPTRRRPSGAFTLSEVLIAATIGGILLAAVLGANLHLARSSVRAARYAELEPQIRRGLEAIGVDLRGASGLVLNGPSDLTLTISDSTGTNTQVTYAWTSDTAAFFRVAGASSAVTTGRIYLIRDLPAAADGTSAVVFERLTSTGATASTDLATKQIRIRLIGSRGLGSGAAATRYESAAFMLRNKPTS